MGGGWGQCKGDHRPSEETISYGNNDNLALSAVGSKPKVQVPGKANSIKTHHLEPTTLNPLHGKAPWFFIVMIINTIS